jgi:hypothetical protein
MLGGFTPIIKFQFGTKTSSHSPANMLEHIGGNNTKIEISVHL